jgi:hypothetical protein
MGISKEKFPRVYIHFFDTNLMIWRYLERHLLDPRGEGLYVEGILKVKIEIFYGIVKGVFYRAVVSLRAFN